MVQHMCNDNIRRSKRERSRRHIWNDNDWDFPQINVRHESTDLESSENTKQDKFPPPPKKLYLGISFLNYRKSKVKKKFWKKPEENNSLLITEQR